MEATYFLALLFKGIFLKRWDRAVTGSVFNEVPVIFFPRLSRTSYKPKSKYNTGKAIP